jgi:hypothetical protein
LEDAAPAAVSLLDQDAILDAALNEAFHPPSIDPVALAAVLPVIDERMDIEEENEAAESDHEEDNFEAEMDEVVEEQEQREEEGKGIEVPARDQQDENIEDVSEELSEEEEKMSPRPASAIHAAPAAAVPAAPREYIRPAAFDEMLFFSFHGSEPPTPASLNLPDPNEPFFPFRNSTGASCTLDYLYNDEEIFILLAGMHMRSLSFTFICTSFCGQYLLICLIRNTAFHIEQLPNNLAAAQSFFRRLYLAAPRPSVKMISFATKYRIKTTKVFCVLVHLFVYSYNKIFLEMRNFERIADQSDSNLLYEERGCVASTSTALSTYNESAPFVYNIMKSKCERNNIFDLCLEGLEGGLPSSFEAGLFLPPLLSSHHGVRCLRVRLRLRTQLPQGWGAAAVGRGDSSGCPHRCPKYTLLRRGSEGCGRDVTRWRQRGWCRVETLIRLRGEEVMGKWLHKGGTLIEWRGGAVANGGNQ